MEGNQENQRPSLFSQILSFLPRVLMGFVIFQMLGGLSKKPVEPTTGASKSTPNQATVQPLWKLGQEMDLYFYIDTTPTFTDFENTSKLVHKQQGLKFGDYATIVKKEVVIDCPLSVQQNGTMFGHFYLTRSDKRVTWSSYEEGDIVYHRKLLTRFMPKKKTILKKSLIGDDAQKNQVVEKTRPIISYWWPNITLNAVATQDHIRLGSLHPRVLEQVRLSKQSTHYFPIFAVNDFWMLQENLQPINETVKELAINFEFSPIAMWKHMMLLQFQESFRMQTEMMGVDVEETEQIKRMFIDTNPILLAITMLVSLLHSVFDFLAFKNDITFWKNRKDMEGLSFRSIVMNVVFQTIIFLYLLDNDTSYLVCLSTGAGLLIEIWKINKTVIVKRKKQFPYLEFIDRVKPSKLSAKTQKYDKMAFGYLSYALFPLMACYTVYSVMYEKHKSWYSFILGTLVGFVYTFGFISMTPQLFINYKLKSVAHMPWKTFMYKALNTFIDDLFAFVIKMPMLHRLACLRDDLIFFIYLYQRWIYPEDKRRRNEFGQVGEEVNEDNDDSETEQEAVEPTAKSSAVETKTLLSRKKAKT